ncbi:MAG: methionyl-tRNA formyltransferase [Candidatus Moranbacteria bacterium]|nr:methionyl-tRNA formyltransferase [Candidatus Moranbacteria bacterium]
MPQSNPQKIKTIFIGTSKLASSILLKLIEEKYQIVAVVTKPDRKIGSKSKRQLAENPIREIAVKNNIPLLQPEKINLDFIREIKNLNPDLIIVTSYGKIIPEDLLNIPKYHCLNVHVSLLPKLRGASPVQNAVLEGLNETGVTIMKMDIGMDDGDIIAQEKIKIKENETAEELSARIFPFGAEKLIEILPNWIEGKIEAEKQNESEATFCKILKREDGEVDWNKSAQEIHNQFRAFTPWPGIFTFWNKDKNKKIRIKLNFIKIYKEEVLSKNLKSGEVFKENKKVLVNTKNGVIEIIELQSEGKKVMRAIDFINGNSDFVGSVLG